MRILSPVFFKELGQMAVSLKPLTMKLILSTVLLLDFLMVMISAGKYYDMASAEMGISLFGSIVFIELIAMAVFAPVVTAGMVCGEREANTLGLLFLTRLKPWNIVQDKGLSRIVFLLIISAMTLPFMFAALLFGGVEPIQIVAAMGNIVSVILFSGGVGMLFSTLSRRYGAALAMSYTALFIGYVLVPILVAIPLSWGSVEWILASINPYASMILVMSEYFVKSNPWILYSWSSNLLLSLLLYLLSVSIAARIVKRQGFSGAVVVEPRAENGIWKWIRDGAFRFHPASWFHRADAVRGNPIEWKESNLRHDSLKTILIRLADFLFIIYLLLMGLAWMESALDDEEVHLIGHAFAFVITAVFVAIMAACPFAREREAGTFDVLLSTRLPGSTIVWGTFSGLWRSILPFVLILFWVLVIGVLATAEFHTGMILGPIGLFLAGGIASLILLKMASMRSFLAWPFFIAAIVFSLLFGWETKEIVILVPLLNILVFFSFIIALGMMMSLRWKSTMMSIGWTLGALLMLCAGLPVLGVAFDDLVDWVDFGEFLFGCSPIYWVAEGPAASEYNEFGDTLGYVLVMISYSMATVLLLRFLARSFDRIAGRQRGV